MLKINKHSNYYEALFLGGNLYAFTLLDLFKQLLTIYNIRTEIFTFDNLN